MMATMTIKKPRTMPDLADYMTPNEAAAKLGFHVNSIHRMAREGKLDYLKVGKRAILISRKSVELYLKETDGMDKRDPRRSASKKGA
jgi:excisionase family DNA binding protein